MPKLAPEGYEAIIEYNGAKYSSGDKIVPIKNMIFVVDYKESSSHTFLIVFSSIIGCIILAIAIFFIYRYLKIKMNKNNLDIEKGIGLFE